ncbi:SPOR domain-containing protein [Stutzerimonas azotifigens]|uniref:SPOR domain-containing protein n=1 Tax=Stutzerimonas azotifigens TaxID=291995 RepID=UPI00042A811E|nr:SPOR domain-containing protein [Stutzerimonas azotifigens]
MRWLFLFLLTLNLLYAVWHQQERPADVKTVAPLSGYQQNKPRLQLLSESPGSVTRAAPVAAADESACVFLGGLEQEASARLIEQRLLSLDIAARVIPVEESAGTDYWVYLPPLASRDAALRQLRELQSRNVDSYVITVGDLSNGVSLGIFSQRESASAVRARIAEMGYSPEIRDLPRVQRTYWVRVEPAGRRLLDERLLESLARQQPRLQHRQMPCEAIATAR